MGVSSSIRSSDRGRSITEIRRAIVRGMGKNMITKPIGLTERRNMKAIVKAKPIKAVKSEVQND